MQKIMGIDINPFYQEQAQYKRFIDWRALKDDPLGLRFIWIKVSEGTDGEGYVEGAARCRAGAQSVKFEAVNPYHYYLYQWCDWSSGAAVWRVISAGEQARAFYGAAQAAGFVGGHPMEDWEDPLIDAFVRWSDTESINKAIAFARKLNAHLRAYHQEIERLFGGRSDIYSGKWWLDKWVPLLIGNGYAAEVAWLKECYWILADYDGTLNIPDYIPAEHVIAWQETSSPVPPVQGIPTGRVVPGDALDIDRWMLSDEEFLIWSGQKGGSTTMANTYNTQVPQMQRAKVLTLNGDQAIKVGPAELGIDAVILPMGGMDRWDGSHQVVYAESTFKARLAQFAAAKVPVMGKFALDASLWLKEQHTASEVEGQTLRDNFILKVLIDQWHNGPWTWDSVLSKKGQWLPIGALILQMTETAGFNGEAPEDWQARTFVHMANHIRYLMENGCAPNVPVILYTGPWWLRAYPNRMAQEIYNRRGWLYLQLGEWILLSTSTFATLADIFAFRPSDTYKFSFYPDVFFERILMHEYTGEAQRVKTITDAAGNPAAVNLSLWCDTAAQLRAFLGSVDLPPVVVVPPVVVPPVTTQATLDDVMTELKALRARVESIFK
jgi:GH25 family lysozyme M1 (1,4-beta-N-acetylmuramidase)